MDDAGSNMQDAIRELNLSYLILAQRILREDIAVGMYRLGISRELADLLVSVSSAQLVKLAETDQFICGFRITDPSLLSVLTHMAKNEQLASTHAAIVLSTQPSLQAA